MTMLGETPKLKPPIDPIEASIEVITPALARIYLERNGVNRRLDKDVVARYARDMRAGQWLVTGEPIAFDTDFYLRQGQHRLRACLAANTSFSSLVVRGIHADAQLAMDSGKKRSLSDQLSLRGEINTGDLSSLINFGWRYDARVARTAVVPTRAEAIAWLEANPRARDCVVLGRRLERKLPVKRRVMTACYFLVSRVNQEDADEFFDRLGTGVGLQEDDPILALRAWFDRWAGKRDQPSSIVHAHATIKCSNYWRSGRTLRFVKVLPSEEFPRVWGEAETS